MMPQEIDPVTFWFVVQCLNHCTSACPPLKNQYVNKFYRNTGPNILCILSLILAYQTLFEYRFFMLG
jgi:hypothetical protein